MNEWYDLYLPSEYGWNRGEDKLWEAGKVFCMYSPTGDLLDIDEVAMIPIEAEEVPSFCKYQLEQVVMNETK